jgi:hypothetical protein
MTQNAVFADEDAQEFQSSPGLGTQLLALGSASCVGVALLFGSIVLGAALFLIVLVTMNVDAGSGWAARFLNPAEWRKRSVVRRASQPAVIR